MMAIHDATIIEGNRLSIIEGIEIFEFQSDYKNIFHSQERHVSKYIFTATFDENCYI